MIPLNTITATTGLAAARLLNYRLNVAHIDELRPGRDPGLDVICDGILKSTPFTYRAEEYS